LGIYRSPATLQTDKLHYLRLKPTLCDPNPLCRGATLATEAWVSVDQIAEHLGVTRDSIYRWIDRKGLPAHRVGRLWKFQVSEVDNWVRAGGADEEKEHE
jgi:excisionase family DNA binding protein